MAFGGCYVLMLLVAVNLLCGMSEVSASKTREMCEVDLATVNLALINSVKNNNRQQFRTECEAYYKLIVECQATVSAGEAHSLSEAHNAACNSPKVKEWLSSSGSAQFSSWVLSTLALLLAVMLR